MKKLQVWWPLWLSLTLILGMWAGYSLKKNIPDSQGFLQRPRRTSVQEVMDLLQRKYVDSVHADSLTDEAIEAMLQELDPHTVYIPAVYTEEANEDLKGNFEGIGVEFYIIDDTVNAVNVLTDGPSDKAGLKLGDKFLKVGDSLVAGNGITPERIRKLLRGEGGSTVSVELLRGNGKVTASITRGTIPKPAVDAAYMMDAQTGFIHLNKFSKTTYEEFMQAMEGLQKKGLKKLVLDLRGNGGGILDEAVDIADEFLSGDKLVLYTEGLHASRQEYKCKRPGLFEEGPLVLLVDEFSASATEVLAGALQDWDRATIVGRRTFGKGLVQEPFELSNGAQLRLTVSRYYTPAGRNIQKPFNGSRSAYSGEVYDRFHNGETSGDSAVHTGKAYKTLVKKRTVYGGGGISPDVYVRFDTSHIAPSLSALFSKQTFSKFIYAYYLQQQPYFRSFKSAADFNKAVTLTPAVLESLKAYCRKDSLELGGLSAADQALLERRYKTNMALQIWRMGGYYEVSNTYDETVAKGLEALKK